MQKTTYYNLNIAEGTDIVNPLTVDNPNYETIDEQMHNNAVACVTVATELSNGTVHAITRQNSECPVFRFIATADWTKGDSATVDGVPVTVLLPSGETLPDRAYIINANVLAVLAGTLLTIYVSPAIPKTAEDISYGDSNVNSALNLLASNDAVKIYSVPTTVTATALQMYRIGNIAMLNASFQLSAKMSWGDIIATLPPELTTTGYFFGFIADNGIVQVSNNQLVAKNIAPVDAGNYITIAMIYPII